MAFPKTSVLDDFSPDDASPMTGWDSPLVGSIGASGGLAVPGGAGYNIAAWATSFTGDMEVYATISTKGASNDEMALTLMAKDTTSILTTDGYDLYITVVAGTDTWAIRRITNGAAAATIASGTQEISNGDVVGLRLKGTTLIAFHNGVQLGSGTDSTYTGTGKIVLSMENTTWRVDDFGGGELTAYTQTNSGGVTPGGAIAKTDNKVVSGSASSSGSTVKQAGKIVSGAVSSIVGTLIKQTGKVVSGAISSAVGELVRQANKVLDGAISSIVGTQTRQANKATDGTVTSAGTISKATGKVISGEMPSGGALSRLTSKLFAGTLTSSGTLATIRTFLVNLAGDLSFGGTIARLTSKNTAGTVSPSGDVSKQTSKSFGGSIASIGTISRVISKALGGVLSWVGSLLTSMFTSIGPGDTPVIYAADVQNISAEPMQCVEAAKLETQNADAIRTIKAEKRRSING